jgi:histidine triad (HIT) family protein
MPRLDEQPSLFEVENLDRNEREARAYTPRRSKKDCVFCKIVAGQAEAFEIMRSKSLVAFLDARPLFPGHVLLIPAKHLPTFDRLPEALAGEWLRESQRIQRAVERATKSHGSLMIVNNVVSQSVPHLHLHVIPRKRNDGLRLWLGPRVPYVNTDEALAMAEAVRAEYDAQVTDGN